MSTSLHVSNSYKSIIQIALPISIAILIPQLSILTNTLFLGYYKPSIAYFSTQDLLAASGVAGIYYLTLSMVGYGLVSGVLMLMSRKAGENDKVGLGKLFTNGVFLCILLSTLLMAFSYYFAPFLFKNTIHELHVQEAAISFIKIRMWGLPFIMLCQLSNNFFLAISNSKRIIIGSLVQTVSNTLFDYIFIFGFWGFTEMGLNGAALASVLSEVLYFLVAFAIIQFAKYFKEFKLNYVANFDLKLMQTTFFKSAPLMMQFFLSIGAWEVFFIYVEHLGKSESALSQIFRSVFGLVGIAAWALASTCNSMVSNLIGQGLIDDVVPLIKKIISVSLLFAICIGLPILFFPSEVLNLLTSDKSLVIKGVTSLRIVVLATWMLSISTILFNGVLGTGNTKTNMMFEFIAIALYLIYITIVIEKLKLPLPYAWMSEFVYWFTLFMLSFLFFYSGKWKKNIN